MIWIALAHGATPEELAAKLPEARAQLETCATTGCQRGEGARAAWLVAVGTYTETGAADGALAATVRELDDGLFATLPDVLRESATEPLSWSTRVGGAERTAVVTPVSTGLPEPFEPGSADLPSPPRRPASLTIRAVDAQQQIVPTATIRFVGEGDLHRVHSETGLWTGTVLYDRDGSERYFEKGSLVTFLVAAPGYAPSKVSYVVSGRRKGFVTVRLDEKSFAADADANWAEKAAIASWTEWSEAERTFVSGPSNDAELAATHARQETARLAREWMDLGGGDEALELCLLTGSLQLCGADR
ncbi:MAG: hypothetical protein R3F61_06685 [Myxococcota bacterium]